MHAFALPSFVYRWKLYLCIHVYFLQSLQKIETAMHCICTNMLVWFIKRLSLISLFIQAKTDVFSSSIMSFITVFIIDNEPVCDLAK